MKSKGCGCKLDTQFYRSAQPTMVGTTRHLENGAPQQHLCEDAATAPNVDGVAVGPGSQRCQVSLYTLHTCHIYCL